MKSNTKRRRSHHSTPISFVPLTDRPTETKAGEAIAKLFGYTLEDVRTASRKPELVTARFAIAYVLHRCHGIPTKAVGRVISRTHSSASYACDQFQNWLDTTPSVTSTLIKCKQAASQVLDNLSITSATSIVHLRGISKRNETPKTAKTIRKKQNKGEKLVSNRQGYEHNRKTPPYSYIYNKNKRVEYILPKRLDNPIFFKAWNEWLDHRRDMKKPHTQGMVDAQLKMMNREGAAISIEAIQLSIENGWLGLFPDKINGKNNNAHIKNNKNINAGYNKGDGSAYEAKARERGAEEVGEVFSL